MLELTFGEQVKIILSRKGMTIKELAEKIEKQTGKKMSRQRNRRKNRKLQNRNRKQHLQERKKGILRLENWSIFIKN